MELTHHSNQHVEQENRNENHEKDENGFRQIRIRDIVELGILKEMWKIGMSNNRKIVCVSR